jgi:DNA-binding transcriptional MerR regulator
MATAQKAPDAFKTIGELSEELGVAQHILRYWESRFPQLRPLQRAGNRRYYRTSDVELARNINRLLNQEGYTVRGVQKLLRDKAAAAGEAAPPSSPEAALAPAPPPIQQQGAPAIDIQRLAQLRDRLAEALAR